MSERRSSTGPAARRLRVLPWLYGTGVVLAAIILGPLLRPGYLLYRDAVSTPRSFVTDAALGIGNLAPRAAPQDWLVAVSSSMLDGELVVLAILAGALVFAAVGYGRLAVRMVPGSGRTGAVAAAVVAVWNPFVAERLLQGHWGLLVGYAMLGWIVVAVLEVAQSPRSVTRWSVCAAVLAVAGLTPTGSILGLVIAALTAVRTRIRLLPLIGVVWLAGAAPWLVASVVGSGSIDSDGAAGVAAFALRSEPFLGPVGTALGLGGIWNADAVPTSRTLWWAAVATAALLIVVAVGLSALWRRRSGIDPRIRTVCIGLLILAGATVLLVAATATAPGRHVVAAVVDAVPGAGVLRDSQKFLALAIPAVAVTAAAAVQAIRRYLPSGFALAAVAVLVVAPLPDLGWGVGGKLAPVHYPADWTRVARMIPADAGAVAVWPPSTVRRYDFTGGAPSLDPLARMVAAPVVESGELRVDGRVVDSAAPVADRVRKALTTADPDAVAALGVGWVLVERDNSSGADVRWRGSTAAPSAVSSLTPVYSGTDLVLYRIDGTPQPGASSAARIASWTAHLVWLSLIVSAAAAAAAAALMQARRPRAPH